MSVFCHKITPEPPSVLEIDPIETSPPTVKPKALRACGMLAGILSSEDYFREKREDTLREDRFLSEAK